jgi:4-amino-4-deoxychorismate mutase
MDDGRTLLDVYRQQIDALDHELLECLHRRFQLTTKVAAVKRKINAPVYQPNRAAVVEQHYLQLGESYGLSREFVVRLCQMIHAESCRLQAEAGLARSSHAEDISKLEAKLDGFNASQDR